MKDKIYHIYIKDECVLHNRSEDKFRENWNILNNLVGLMKTDYNAEDLSYETVKPYDPAESLYGDQSY